jgi:hypothetical protein
MVRNGRGDEDLEFEGEAITPEINNTELGVGCESGVRMDRQRP